MTKIVGLDGQPTHFITKIISNIDLVAFQSEVEGFKKGKKILYERKGCTLLPTGHPQGVGIVAVPWCYLEYQCTSEEFNSWKFTQTIMP